MKTTDLLSLPSRGFRQLVGDAEGLFMFCHEVTANYLAQRLISKRILELCCGIGAITAPLSKYASVVFAVDADPLRIRCAEINVETYGNADNARFRHEDALSEAIWKEAQPDVIFADPDWAKPGDSKDDHTPDLSATQPPVPEILGMARKTGVPGVVIRLSPKSDLNQLKEWGPYEAQRVFVDESEKYWLVYFGSACNRPGVTEDLRLTS